MQTPETDYKDLLARVMKLESQNRFLRGQMTVVDNKSVLELFDATGKVTWTTGTATHF